MKAKRETIVIVLILFVWTVAFAFLHKPFSQSEQGDPSIYDYIAQSILRGHIPYRDAIDPKAPASMYMSAFALLIGRFLTVPDIFAIRLFHILLYGLLSVAIYLVAFRFLKDKWAAVLAALIPILPGRFPVMMIVGTQPKLAMILFGMFALIAIYRDRPFLAGLMSMISCLCWQPGLMFGGVAFLYFSRYLTSWKDKRALKLLLGAVIPLLTTVFYFYLRGGLSSFAAWTFTYDYSVYMPTDEKPLSKALGHFWKVVNRIFARDITIFYLAAAGFGWYLIRRVAVLIKDRSPFTRDSSFGDCVVLSVIVYFAFCMINMQSGPDLIPFLPFFGIFGAFAVLEVTRGIGLLLRSANKFTQARTAGAFMTVVLLLVVFYTVKRVRKYRLEPPTLAQQYDDLAVLKSYLNPGDKIYAHGSTEVLVFLNEQNASPYVAFDTGADEYIAARTPGGFPGVISQLDGQAPKIVVMTRLTNVLHRKELENWVNEQYAPIHVPSLMAVYVRKSNSQGTGLKP